MCGDDAGREIELSRCGGKAAVFDHFDERKH
jgi:hypothetical protein